MGRRAGVSGPWPRPQTLLCPSVRTQASHEAKPLHTSPPLINSDMHPTGLGPLSPTQSCSNQKQDAPNQTQLTSARQAVGAWGPGACPMCPRPWPVFCQLHTPHGRCVWGGCTWPCMGTKPVSLGPQTHDGLTLHSGVKRPSRDLHRLPLADLGWGSRLASPCTPQ